MRFILLLTIILLSSCENKKETIVNRQQAIKKETEQVKAFYYKKLDSLESVKEADTISAKQMEIVALAEREKTAALLKLQKELDSLEAALKNY
jgi:PBP1b-binding outer membrane lipoprotein LpoB